MSCRTNRGSSAITSYSRADSGLGDVQTLSLFHQLMSSDAARNAPQPEPVVVQEWLDSFSNQVRANTAVNQGQRQRVLERVQNLDNGAMPGGAMFYAWREIAPAAQASRAAIERAYEGVAEGLSLDRAALQSRIRQLEQAYQAEPAHRRQRPAEAATILERFRSLADSNEQGSNAGGNNGDDAGSHPSNSNSNNNASYALPQDPTTLAVWSTLLTQMDSRRTAEFEEAAATTPNTPTTTNQSSHCPDCGQFIGGEQADTHNCPTPPSMSPTTSVVTEQNILPPVASAAISATAVNTNAVTNSNGADTVTTAAATTNTTGPSRPPLPPPPPPRPTNTVWVGRVNSVRQTVGEQMTDLVALRRQLLSEQQDQLQARKADAPLVFRPAPKFSGEEGESVFNQWATELKAARARTPLPHSPAVTSAGEQANSSSSTLTPPTTRMTSDSPVSSSRSDDSSVEAVSGEGNASSVVNYETEQVLGEAAANFGVELEFRTADANVLARKLYDAGLTVHPQMVGYHHDCAECRAAGPGKWKVERDGSVTEIDRNGRSLGGEVVSPILADTPQDWQALKTVTDIIGELGGTVDHHTGQHVHVSTAAYQNNPASYRDLAVLVAQNEDLLFRLSAPDVEQHRGLVRTDHAAYHYTQPISRRVEQLTSQPEPSLPQVLNAMGVNERVAGSSNPLAHYMSLNMQHVNQADAAQSRVEFRTFNGAIDPVQIQTNVRLATAMVYAANHHPPSPAPTANTQAQAENLDSSGDNTNGHLASSPSVPVVVVAAAPTPTTAETTVAEEAVASVSGGRRGGRRGRNANTPPTLAAPAPGVVLNRGLGWHKQHHSEDEDNLQVRGLFDRLDCLSENGAKSILDLFLRSKWQRNSRG